MSKTRQLSQPPLGAKFGIELATAGLMNREHETRIEAQRCTAQFRVPIAPSAPQDAIEDLPLFGGERQGDLF